MSDLSTDLRAGALEFPLLLANDAEPVGALAVHSPYDQSLLGTAATAGAEHADQALATAYALFRNRDAWLPVHERLAILERLAVAMEAAADELALLAASEGGKPLRDSAVEVTRAIDGVRLCTEALRSPPGSVIPVGTTAAAAGRTAFTTREPIGVVVAVSAFNHPLNLIVHQVGPAVAAGCPVIVKPAEDTPFSCLRLVQLLHEAGLPRGWCQALVADNLDTAERLVTDRRVAFFSFIGSARVGWTLRSKLAPGTRCALEHGGAAPVLLAEPFDRDLALASILKGGFYHAGQVCVSVQRVFAPRSAARGFAKALAAAAEGLEVGNPTLEATEVGPLIRPAELERVAEWVDEAVAGGAQLLCGGRALSNSCYAPTVLLDPPEDCRVSRDEIFGPVVCVYAYDELDAAVEQANSLPTAFQAAVFTHDVEHGMYLYQRLDASAVMLNDHTAFRDDVMPFAGLRESGLGVGGIPYTFEDMQVDKLLVLRSGQPGC
ncbi:MAG: aldehyde dehydrogenase family protein [Xanthomonadales bacterium]|nr:aldehyde dehydrogenase family protein [Xanthomonadales bacterium]